MDLFSQCLSRYILANTAQEVFRRGIQYAKEGRVKDIRLQGKTLFAVVQGSLNYEVELRQGPKYTKGYCTCPYALNEDYCKHVVALAVSWDLQRNIEAPSEKEVRENAVEIEHGFDRKIDMLYADPLHADLQLLAKASDYGSWVRPHAKIKIYSPLADIVRPVSCKEVRLALQNIQRIERRSSYDAYFCAGEVSALLSLIFDSVIKRLEYTNSEEYLDILTECITFYYNKYLTLIDGSDGVWQIPFARLQLIFGELQNRGIAQTQQEKLRLSLADSITGWGDIFEELKTQF